MFTFLRTLLFTACSFCLRRLLSLNSLSGSSLLLWGGFNPPPALRYVLCGLPEVSRVRQPAVEFGEFLQHVRELGEGRPAVRVRGPAGREDLLVRQRVNLLKTHLDIVSIRLDHSASSADSLWAINHQTEQTHRHLFAQAGVCQDLLYALSAAYQPDFCLHGKVSDWPVPGLQLIPNRAENSIKQTNQSHEMSSIALKLQPSSAW